MADESSGNGSGIVAIFAIVVLAALAVAAVMYILPRMQQSAPPADGMNIKVEMPAPQVEAEPAP